MKTINTIVKVLTALAAVAGAVYVIATYGDKIVAWAKNLLASLPKCPCCQECDVVDAEDEVPVEDAPVEEAEEEAPVEEETPVEEPAPVEEEVPAAPLPNEPVAEDHDFAE